MKAETVDYVIRICVHVYKAVRLTAIGFENETAEESDMPLRVMSYDAAGYRAQISNGSDRRYPVVSLVLYYGYKKKWSKAKTLYDRLEVPDELKRYVFDYGMNLFQIAYLDDATVAKFKSDFRFVADYFVQMRKTGRYIAPDEKITHVQEMLSLMSALTDDNRFSDVYEGIKGEERVSMCTVLDEIETRGIEKGIKEGIEQGRDNTLISLVHDGLLSIEVAADRAGVTLDEFKAMMKKVY
ncbi:Putative transposase, YhgA-like [Butyrivibrio hungatei]|uniref:Putative transposase, YhgA-like n=1 Tax=Butyrivibrio hungatei TaxID=185008 RepID=A0A1G5C8W0_9FIRM|nr:Rpn family recombination-promoting nuclease/putative transposase [Butyrivibrio hungatei]SCX98740.1 Putative transposase, YhgA-like [Butyrivibrio hungatei]